MEHETVGVNLSGAPLSMVIKQMVEIYGVPAPSAAAFGARVKNFARLGLFPSAPPGQGRDRLLTESEMLDLAAVLEMTALGLPPERALSILRANCEFIRRAAYNVEEIELAMDSAIGEAGITSTIKLSFGGLYTAAWPQILLERGRELSNRRAGSERSCGAGSTQLRELRRRLPSRQPHDPNDSPATLRDDLLKGAKAAADYIGISNRSVYRMVETKTIPFIKMGDLLFFRRSELDAAFHAGFSGDDT